VGKLLDDTSGYNQLLQQLPHGLHSAAGHAAGPPLLRLEDKTPCVFHGTRPVAPAELLPSRRAALDVLGLLDGTSVPIV